MSEFINEINKIYIDSPLQVKNVNMTTLLFSDGLLSPKTNYTITDNQLFLKDQAEISLNLFQFVDSSNYYEFLMDLTENWTAISGSDRYGNELNKLSDTVLVFVNGYKLSSAEYVLDETENKIIIKSSYNEKKLSTIVIYTSNDAEYEGNVEEDFSWDPQYNQFLLKDYTIDRYIFFKNGELLQPSKVQKVGNYVRINTTIKHGVDFVEYYRMSKDCYALTFTPSFGYLTYGPKDDRGMTIQNLYNCMITFNNIVRLAIDDVRPGFFVHEKDKDGCVMIVDDNFEGCSVKCITITPFEKTELSSSEYFLTVPDAPSIMKYVSQYDLNGTLFKELLTCFQKVLLNETYDTVQRLKNIRNINKVDSSNISALINFLGLQINVTNLNLEKKHNLIEELRTFYDTVGTRASYNFYNAFQHEGKILNLQQLFTPIKSTKVKIDEETHEEIIPEDAVKRYVHFKTAEELGAIEKQRYVTETVDFGQVSELAINGVNLANTPRYEGVLRYQNYPPILKGVIDRYHSTDTTPILSEDEITLSVTVNSVVRFANISEDNNYECEINEETGEIFLIKYLGTNSNIKVPATINYQTRKVADISVIPSNLRVELYNSNGKKLRIYGYDEITNTFTFLLDNASEYTYKILDKTKNVLFSAQLEDGDNTVFTILPLINDYTSAPKQGPNKPSIDCGYITDNPVDFYDFGSVAEQLRGHWVSWYEWSTRGDWYPTNHVDVSIEIPFSMDYDTFMNVFKDTFYQMASAVLYIHQITQIYMFGDPNNSGLTEIQPMSLLTTQSYKTEEQCFTNDHEFLPYKKAVANKPLELKSYMFKNPTYSFENNEYLKVSVELYKNFGRDEYLYKTTGEEKDIEWTETIVGRFPCKQLSFTDWTVEQVTIDTETIDQRTSDTSWEVIDTIPTFTVTCTPNTDRTDWLYSLVINYDNREEGYIISKDLQTITKIVESNVIKDLQTVIDGKIEYVRPNSLFYEKGAWYLGYVTLDEEFSVFEWKLATLNNINPEDRHENLKSGIAQYSLKEASLINWNFNRTNEVIVDNKIDIDDNKAYIWINTNEEVYSRINNEFDINNSPYETNYSYSYNNTIWSCDLKKYNVYNNVQLESEAKTNCTTLLLPTNIIYIDNNNGFTYQFGETDYQFNKIKAELNESTQIIGQYVYTNKLSSTFRDSSLSFNTNGTLIKNIVYTPIVPILDEVANLLGASIPQDWSTYNGEDKGYNQRGTPNNYVSEQTLADVWRYLNRNETYWSIDNISFTKETTTKGTPFSRVLYLNGNFTQISGHEFALYGNFKMFYTSSSSSIHNQTSDTATKSSYTKDNKTVYYSYWNMTDSGGFGLRVSNTVTYQSLEAAVNNYNEFDQEVGENIGLAAWKAVYGDASEKTIGNDMTDEEILNRLKSDTTIWNNKAIINGKDYPYLPSLQ